MNETDVIEQEKAEEQPAKIVTVRPAPGREGMVRIDGADLGRLREAMGRELRLPKHAAALNLNPVEYARLGTSARKAGVVMEFDAEN